MFLKSCHEMEVRVPNRTSWASHGSLVETGLQPRSKIQNGVSRILFCRHTRILLKIQNGVSRINAQSQNSMRGKNPVSSLVRLFHTYFSNTQDEISKTNGIINEKELPGHFLSVLEKASQLNPLWKQKAKPQSVQCLAGFWLCGSQPYAIHA